MTEMTLEQKEKEVQRLASTLSGLQLKFGNNILAGMYQDKAYKTAGYKSQNPAQMASKSLATSKKLRDYIELSKELAADRAAQELQYDEQKWLSDILEAVDMSLGREDMVAQAVVEGAVRNLKVKEVNLQAFARLSEQLGKKLALFTEKKVLEGGLGLITKSIDKDTPPTEAAAIYQEMIGKK